jgi:alpha-tubulin suppressor-like RCC1 family protein
MLLTNSNSSDGRLFSIGKNYFGCLGTGDANDNTVETSYKQLTTGTAGIKFESIAHNSDSTFLACDSNKVFYAWGKMLDGTDAKQ